MKKIVIQLPAPLATYLRTKSISLSLSNIPKNLNHLSKLFKMMLLLTLPQFTAAETASNSTSACIFCTYDQVTAVDPAEKNQTALQIFFLKNYKDLSLTIYKLAKLCNLTIKSSNAPPFTYRLWQNISIWYEQNSCGFGVEFFTHGNFSAKNYNCLQEAILNNTAPTITWEQCQPDPSFPFLKIISFVAFPLLLLAILCSIKYSHSIRYFFNEGAALLRGCYRADADLEEFDRADEQPAATRTGELKIQALPSIPASIPHREDSDRQTQPTGTLDNSPSSKENNNRMKFFLTSEQGQEREISPPNTNVVNVWMLPKH